MSTLMDQKLEIYEDESALEISFKWFNPAAFFLLFFTIFWVGFLVFWYAVSFSTGAPLIALLFPLIHVSVGVGLAYYVLCLFFNKTYFHIHDGHLNVVHQPIPWWKGNRSINIEEITQFYVKEKVTRGKNGEKRSYDLRAKLRNKQDKSILALDNISSSTAQEIEERLERFLGIQNQAVKGEYQSNYNQAVSQKFKTARQHRSATFDSEFSSLFFAKASEQIHFEGTPLKVAAIAQYDWHNGNTDKLLQLLNEEQRETILYIRQQKALLSVYQEEDIIQGKIPINFNKTAPERTIEMDGRTYFLEQSYLGESFFSFANGHTDTSQWVYLTEDGQHYLRIQEQKGQLTYSLGRKLSTDDFSQPLNLNDLPAPPIPKPQPKDWDQKDFV